MRETVHVRERLQQLCVVAIKDQLLRPAVLEAILFSGFLPICIPFGLFAVFASKAIYCIFDQAHRHYSFGIKT